MENLEGSGEIFMICPETPLQIGRMSHDPEEIRKAYQRGREDAQRKLPAMKEWLDNRK